MAENNEKIVEISIGYTRHPAILYSLITMMETATTKAITAMVMPTAGPGATGSTSFDTEDDDALPVRTEDDTLRVTGATAGSRTMLEVRVTAALRESAAP